jgi:hypothetical protein
LDLATNSKPLPGLILRLFMLTPMRQVGIGINGMACHRLHLWLLMFNSFRVQEMLINLAKIAHLEIGS